MQRLIQGPILQKYKKIFNKVLIQNVHDIMCTLSKVENVGPFSCSVMAMKFETP